MNEKRRPALGQRVSFTATAHKEIKTPDRDKRYTYFYSSPTPAPKYGVYVGYRRWTSGTTQSINNRRCYQVEHVAEVWLVVTTPCRKPIPIFPADCVIDDLPEKIEDYLNDLLNSGKD